MAPLVTPAMACSPESPIDSRWASTESERSKHASIGAWIVGRDSRSRMPPSSSATGRCSQSVMPRPRRPISLSRSGWKRPSQSRS